MRRIGSVEAKLLSKFANPSLLRRFAVLDFASGHGDLAAMATVDRSSDEQHLAVECVRIASTRTTVRAACTGGDGWHQECDDHRASR